MKNIVMATVVATSALMASCQHSAPQASLKTDVDTVSYALGLAQTGSKEDFERMLSMQGSDSAYIQEFFKGIMDGVKSADDKKKMAYNMGVQTGLQLKMGMPNFEGQLFQGDSTKHISVKNFLAGFMALANDNVVLEKDGKPMTREEAYAEVMAYMFKKQQAESAQFMAAKAKEAGVKKLANGILYKELAKGTSAAPSGATDSVVVKYEGRLADGTVFDSSEGVNAEGVTMSLKNVIKGWQVAVPQMPVGSTWEVYIPEDQAYGSQPMRGIPPYSALTFKITLVKVGK